MVCLWKFGSGGLYAFSTCAFVLANIQVLRTTDYFFQESAIALGNIAFSAIFLANNILVEYYGIRCAKKIYI